MAKAIRCDICGRFYEVPEGKRLQYEWGTDRNADVIIIHKFKNDSNGPTHDDMLFDSCRNCTQALIEYILTRNADAVNGRENYN